MPAFEVHHLLAVRCAAAVAETEPQPRQIDVASPPCHAPGSRSTGVLFGLNEPVLNQYRVAEPLTLGRR
jgi:hypothetical protein